MTLILLAAKACSWNTWLDTSTSLGGSRSAVQMLLKMGWTCRNSVRSILSSGSQKFWTSHPHPTCVFPGSSRAKPRTPMTTLAAASSELWSGSEHLWIIVDPVSGNPSRFDMSDMSMWWPQWWSSAVHYQAINRIMAFRPSWIGLDRLELMFVHSVPLNWKCISLSCFPF